MITGIGRAGQTGEIVARTLAEHGARLFLVDLSREEAEARAADLVGAGFGASGFGRDLTDGTATLALAHEIGALTGGKLGALVNLAGGFAMSGRVADSEPSQWERQFAINLATAFLATRAFLPLLRRSQGSIVFMTSLAALPGGRSVEMGAYAAAKAAVVSLMRTVAQEEREHGVRANAIAPSAIRTGDNTQAMKAGTRFVEREQVADAIHFLCSTASSAVTGQIVALE